MFVIKNLDFKIDNFHLKIDHFDLSNHKIVALMGPSGSGKSTFFNILIGLYKPINWSWIFNGRQFAGLNMDQRQLGIVFQKNELFPHLTAEENVKIVMKSRNVQLETDFVRLEKYKSVLKLNNCWLTRADKLSGGEAQRVSLLRAVMSRPVLLLLDEPFSSLDADLKVEARKMTSDLVREAGIPTLLITHDIEDANALGASIRRMNQGRILAELDADEI